MASGDGSPSPLRFLSCWPTFTFLDLGTPWSCFILTVSKFGLGGRSCRSRCFACVQAWSAWVQVPALALRCRCLKTHTPSGSGNDSSGCVLAIQVRDLHCIPGFWLQLSPALTIGGFLRVDLVRSLSVSQKICLKFRFQPCGMAGKAITHLGSSRRTFRIFVTAGGRAS